MPTVDEILAKRAALDAEGQLPVTPALLSSPQACEYLQISKDALSCLTRDNRLPIVKIDGRRRFRRIDLDAFIIANLGPGRGRSNVGVVGRARALANNAARRAVAQQRNATA